MFGDEPQTCLACDALEAPTEGYTAACKNCGGTFCIGHMHHQDRCRGPFYKGPDDTVGIDEARRPDVILRTIRKEA